MTVRLKELGHVLEEDPEHGGTFLALPGQSHAIDLFQVKDADAARRQTPGVRGLGHIAFRVESEEALREAYASLREHGVAITRTIDHLSQKSVYFEDPDGNTLEIYYELPDALAIFARGREDRDVPLVLDRQGDLR